ncbi:hypothetical protein HRF87_17095 [Bacillus sp. CRN 9]|nr:hypothetical protein [Bacillus sp. CRN 9]
MAIIMNVDVMLTHRKMSETDFLERVEVTNSLPANKRDDARLGKNLKQDASL